MPAKAFLLFLIVFLSLISRIVNLTDLPNGAYWDELDAGYQAYSLLKTGRDYQGNIFPVFLQSFADFRTPIALYSIVPFLPIYSLTLEAVRINTVIWSIVSLLGVFVLSSRLFPKYGITAGLISTALFSLSPWHFHYSRLGLEPISLVTIICVALAVFLKGVTNPRWLPLSALFFGLGIYTYSTAKFWIPALVLGIIIIYFKKIIVLPKRTLIISAIGVFLISLPFFIDTVIGSNITRFSHVSIFTDPTLRSEIDTARGRSLSSAVGNLEVGSSPRFIDAALNNVPLKLSEQFISNYFSAFSFDFLFTRGDQQLRHSPGVDSIGQLLYPDAVFLIFGLALLITKFAKQSQTRLIFVLLLTAPIAASITRDGAGHASRLINLLVPLTLVTTLGIAKYTHTLTRASLVIAIYGLFSVHFLGYYFTQYKLESAKPFQYGFQKIIQLANQYSSAGQEVIIDTRREYSLMAYLFFNAIDPQQFQKMSHDDTYTLANGFSGRKFGQVLLLYPGDRAWTTADLVPGTTLILDSGAAGRPSTNLLTETIFYPGPDKEEAYFVFTSPR